LKKAKLLVVNADDFGFTTDVNDGIIEGHRGGILTATTLLAGGGAFDHAVRLAKAHPTLDVGCHLALVGGKSSIPPFRELPGSVAQLIEAIALRQIRVYDEFVAQMNKLIASGLNLTHLDTHKHTHLLPSVAAAVGRVSREFGIPWVRRPLPLPLAEPFLCAILRRQGCRMTDYFLGFRQTGKLGTAAMAGLISSLSEGSSEIMCHPGYFGRELRASRTRLKQSRALELEALLSPEVREAVDRAGVRLVNYAELAGMPHQ
jgi:predicted glycoside hydrolase/deacetylase ChbG (UPF0249 family)